MLDMRLKGTYFSIWYSLVLHYKTICYPRVESSAATLHAIAKKLCWTTYDYLALMNTKYRKISKSFRRY